MSDDRTVVVLVPAVRGGTIYPRWDEVPRSEALRRLEGTETGRKRPPTRASRPCSRSPLRSRRGSRRSSSPPSTGRGDERAQPRSWSSSAASRRPTNLTPRRLSRPPSAFLRWPTRTRRRADPPRRYHAAGAPPPLRPRVLEHLLAGRESRLRACRLSEKPVAGDYVGAGSARRPWPAPPCRNTRPCRRCGTACGAVYCGPVREARDSPPGRGRLRAGGARAPGRALSPAGRAALDEPRARRRRPRGARTCSERDGRVRRWAYSTAG